LRHEKIQHLETRIILGIKLLDVAVMTYAIFAPDESALILDIYGTTSRCESTKFAFSERNLKLSCTEKEKQARGRPLINSKIPFLPPLWKCRGWRENITQLAVNYSGDVIGSSSSSRECRNHDLRTQVPH
jgi:hypothetical protein